MFVNPDDEGDFKDFEKFGEFDGSSGRFEILVSYINLIRTESYVLEL